MEKFWGVIVSFSLFTGGLNSAHAAELPLGTTFAVRDVSSENFSGFDFTRHRLKPISMATVSMTKFRAATPNGA